MISANTITAVNQEWARLGADAAASARVADWLVDAGVLDATSDGVLLEELLPALQRRGSAYGDRWLPVLLQHAAGRGADADLAAQVVVKAMLPAAIRTARSVRDRAGHSWEEVTQVVIGALYLQVRTYPLARRPRRIAANLALDLLGAVRRELSLERAADACGEWVEEFTDDPLEMDSAAGWHALLHMAPAEAAHRAELAKAAAGAGLMEPGSDSQDLCGARGEVVELLLWALDEGVLTAADTQSINAHYRADAPSDEAAARCAGLRPATLRQRRSRAVRRLAAAAPRWQYAQAA